MASYKGHLNIAQYLVNECHVDPDIADSSGNTGLLYSALGGHVDLVIMFLKKKCNVSQVNREGSTLSLLACKSGEVALVDQLKQFGIFSEDDIDFKGCGIVHYCAMSDSVELLEYLCNNHNIGHFQNRDRFGATPLHIACQYASSGLIVKIIIIFGGYKVLLEADYSGRSCLHYLCSGLVDKYCNTEVYNKLTAPCDIPLLMQVISFNTGMKKWGKYVSLNTNVTKQHKRVNLLSTILKKTSVINNFNINSITATGQSLVHLACTSGSILLVKVLEEYGINTSSLDYEGRSAVHYAALSGSPTLLSYTVSEYSLNASQQDYKGVVPLALACMSGSINAVEYIMNTTDIDINIKCNEGRTPLHYSCHHGNVTLSQYLIEVQECVYNTKDNIKWNALTHSAMSGNKKLVQYLINHRLSFTKFTLAVSLEASVIYGSVHVLEWFRQEYSINVVSFSKGILPFHATKYNNFYCLKHLLNNYSFDINATDPFDNTQSTLLHIACQEGHVAIVLYLTSLPKCNVSAKTSNGSTVLHLSCKSRSLPILKHLVEEHQLDLTIRDDNGMAPVHVACEEGSLSIVKYIIDHSPLSLDMTDSFGRTPLLIAAFSKNLPIIRYLNSKNCNISILDDKGFNVIHISAKRGYVTQTHGKTHNTFKLEVEQIFEVKRDKEEENFKDVGNRQLLWHGSRLTNWVGILSQGLRIAPPEAPVTGYMFGKGVYFADMCSKSANYCFATRSRNEGLLLLSEVSLGTPNELLSADYNADKLPAGRQSVHGKGRMVPNPAYNHTLPDGCVVPLGTPIDTGLTNTGGYTLNYNEFIVYDTNQVKMRYFVLLKFKLKKETLLNENTFK
uniref:Poly [ADP-ribose] polymerase n=1 Tax=Amphimedon queenslandica TaxID=400682 RepID=A0A1X7UIV1_AMPQE